MKTLDLEIREWLSQFLSRKISLEQFEELFVPASWNVLKQNNQTAIELVGEIELRLAEYSSGHLTEKDLMEKLSSLLFDVRVDVFFGTGAPGVTTVTGSEAQTLKQFAGRSRVAAS